MLLVLRVGLAVSGVILLGACGQVFPRFKPSAASSKAQTIYKMLAAYAIDHDGKLPVGATNSNEAFRALFTSQLMDSGGERVFSIAPTLSADGKIGEEPTFAQALEAGENDWSYLSGTTMNADHSQPLMYGKFDGKIFVTYVSGSTKVLDPGTEFEPPVVAGCQWLHPLVK
jgi:hypothetical protein